MDAILAHEPALRLVAFLGVFAVMAALEYVIPRRRLRLSKGYRWLNNIALVALNTALLRVLIPLGAVGVALWADETGRGLFNLIAAPAWLEIVAAVVILDLAIWAQHLVFHYVPVLWRLHRLHHADQDYDVTTGARFHPIEILLSMLIKMGLVAALGVPAVAVILFEVILSAMAIFNHANIRLPERLDAVLRLIVVTPDFHRVHHSAVMAETNSNFGFNLSLWDRLFGTYVAQPTGGHEGMTVGLEYFRTPLAQRLDKMLVQPFREAR
jgi:sterol desaturase/sphingolipid hydroxylase (fatty acid hydroxylase superfamily)